MFEWRFQKYGGHRLVDENGVLGRVKYSAASYRSKYRGMEEYGSKQANEWMWSSIVVPT